MAITDAVSVMRRGAMVAHHRTAETTQEQLAEEMVGRKVRLDLEKTAASPGQPLLEATGITVVDQDGVTRLDHVDLAVRAGEIVGVAGVSGNGQSELLEVLSGIRPLDDGRLVVKGREVTPGKPCNPAEMRHLGDGHVPEDRQRLGLVGPFSASESTILGYHRDTVFNGRLLMDGPVIRNHCAELQDQFDVRPRNPDLKSAKFSGGNQQKLVIAREIAHDPQILLVGQPTRGVDIGAIEFIHRQLIDMRDAGCGILLVSVELDEIMSLADRIVVMFEGRIVGEVDGAAADERTLGLMMANVVPDHVERGAAP